jgi:hypothetical protein
VPVAAEAAPADNDKVSRLGQICARAGEPIRGPRRCTPLHPPTLRWIDLVVRPPGRGPDFVGKSYAGEAAIPQLCNYALGVLDKASGTFKVVPIAGNKVCGSSCCTKISIFSLRKKIQFQMGIKTVLVHLNLKKTILILCTAI